MVYNVPSPVIIQDSQVLSQIATILVFFILGKIIYAC